MIARNTTDLALVVGLLAGTVAALLAPGVPWPVEWAFGAAFLLGLPGYAVVAALFPRTPEQTPTDHVAPPSWVARAALSLLASVLVVAATGVLLGAVGWLTLTPVVAVVAVVTLAAVVVAYGRRRRLPADRRGNPLGALSPSAALVGPRTSRTQAAVTLLAVVVLLASLGFVAATPSPEPGYSEVTMPREDANASVGSAPQALVAGEDNTVALSLENHEGESTAYTVRVQLQRVGANGSVLEQERLDSFRATLADNETARYERDLSPSMTGEDLRLRTLVYEGDASGDPDLSLRVWVDVAEAGSS